MKTNLFCLILVLITGLYACKKELDPVFDKSPDARINETLRQYQAVLTGAPYGWKALVYPAGVPNSVFSFFFRFNDSNRVQMFSDLDGTSSVKMRESSWRLKSLQQPSLLFDTYSYLHVLCDPDAGNNGGSYGQGLGSDFEFAINSLHGDTIELTGRFHSSKALLVKATQQDMDNYYQHRMNRDIDSVSAILTYFRRLTAGNAKYDIRISQNLHLMNFTWVYKGKAQTFTTGYYYTPDGIRLSPAFNDSTSVISSIDNIRWSNGQLTCSVNGSAATIGETVRPLALDVNAPQRWYKYALDRGRYWGSDEGFHVNGADDAFHIRSLPDFFQLVFWPQAQGAGVDFDMLGFVLKVGDARPTLSYGPAYTQPDFTSDGRAVFSDIGLYGKLPPDKTPVLRSRAVMANPQGFYLIQVGPVAYDMVSASDGKSWISWSF
ncbi:MAG TPA: DUF4302 domain-containing protein [Chitinophaga sp.]|uniref:DUF4302 domain-containing protein n=1 Tax=Chitinophaga sp. TaxID=1869181 RepID=UPI002CE5B34A|nr:DUF4302 domain-containing protein [Chitinophaga sp.]HVI47862.1 DUF4302 domain-containing protein [Chitinophaga sp.]